MNVPPSNPPPEVPGFEILEALGEGAMGSVWKARRQDDGRLVALKLLRRFDEDEGSDAALRLQDEARLLEGLQHPNLVAFLGAGSGRDGPWMAMELVEGMTMEERIHREAPMAADACATMILPLLDAVSVIHRAGIIHRDVKAANVFIDGEGRPRLGDFGLARSREARLARTATGFILGTPDTMAPEQAMAGHPCPSWDLYALGCIAFRCLTGEHPFPGANAVEVLRRKQSEAPPLLRRFRPDLPPPLEGVLARSMARRPEARYRRAETMRRELEEAFAGRSPASASVLTRQLSPASSPTLSLSAAGPRSRPSPSGTSPFRSRGLAVAALAAMALLVAILLRSVVPTRHVPFAPHLEWRSTGHVLRWSGAEGLAGRIELARDDAPPRIFEGEPLDGDHLFPLPEGFREGRVRARFFDGAGRPTLWRRLPLTGAPPFLVPRLDATGRLLGGTILLDEEARIEIRDGEGPLLARSERATSRLAFDLPPGRVPAFLRIECMRPDRLPLHVHLPAPDGEAERRELVGDLGRSDATRFLAERARRDGGLSEPNRNGVIRSFLDEKHLMERLEGLGAHLAAFMEKGPLDERLALCQAFLDLEVLGGLSLAFDEAPLFVPWPRVAPLVVPRRAGTPPPGPILHRIRFDYHDLARRQPWFTDQGRILVGEAYAQALARQHARLGETARRSERGSSDEAAMRFMLFLDETGRNILKDPAPYRQAHLELPLPSLDGAKHAVLTLGVVKMQTRNCIRVRINDRLAVPFRPGWREDQRSQGISGLFHLSRRIPPEILHEGTNRFEFVMDDLPGVEGILLTLRPKLAQVLLDVTR